MECARTLSYDCEYSPEHAFAEFCRHFPVAVVVTCIGNYVSGLDMATKSKYMVFLYKFCFSGPPQKKDNKDKPADGRSS